MAKMSKNRQKPSKYQKNGKNVETKVKHRQKYRKILKKPSKISKNLKKTVKNMEEAGKNRQKYRKTCKSEEKPVKNNQK